MKVLFANDYTKLSHLYAQHGIYGTGYLAFRDIPMLVKQYVAGRLALDYGSGAGRSMKFLADLGFCVYGLDVSLAMLQRSSIKRVAQIDIHANYLPVKDNTFDLVFSSFVFLEMPTLSMILDCFCKIKKVLKKTGIFIFVTVSDVFYWQNWLTSKVNIAENNNLQPGSKAEVYITYSGVKLIDYYWRQCDYENILTKAGLQILKVHHPVGDKRDGYSWLDETEKPPFSVFVCA